MVGEFGTVVRLDLGLVEEDEMVGYAATFE